MITIGLPVYNNKNIAWLAMEGLCNQVTGQEWELIVCEENNGNHCGLEFFDEYKDRLFEKGCSRFVYIPVVKGRFYLSDKWKFMATHAKGDIFLLQGADDYPDPRRIEESWQAFKEGYDWFHTPDFWCYLKNVGMFRYKDDQNHLHTGIDKGTLTKYILQCDDRKIARGVDGWMLSNVRAITQRENIKRITYKNYLGVSTTGFNIISKNRDMQLIGEGYPFSKTDIKLEQILPYNLALKLKENESTEN